jgi:biopolymer transport protein ExbD
MTSSESHRNEPISAINVTPLVDVMLVLLIVFMIAAPLASARIPVDLQRAEGRDRRPPPPIRLSLDARGALFWDGQPLARELFELQLQIEAGKEPQPVLQIDADPLVEYQALADVMGSARNAGLTRVGFEP